MTDRSIIGTATGSPPPQDEGELDDRIARMSEFVRLHCEGREYDSCFNSPCRYASVDGCRHPLHPKRGERKAEG